MPRAEVGTPKFIANKMKSKGLQRLRWYCQVCQKQCRDENGFKCHAQSESHLRQMLVVGEHAGRHISDFSAQFQSEFVKLLARRFGTRRVKANNVYQEYIQDKHHLHMNSTRWVTLTEFCKHLGRAGIARVDETEKGWFIAWIDNSPKALAKQEAAMKKERLTTSDEQRERNLIAEQIERAKATADENGEVTTQEPAEGGLKRTDEAQKVVLSLSAAKPASPTTPPPSGTPPAAPAPGIIGLKLNPLKAPSANPLKRPNVLKSASSAAGSSATTTTTGGEDKGRKRERPMSAAESLIYEEEQRKKRKMEREGR